MFFDRRNIFSNIFENIFSKIGKTRKHQNDLEKSKIKNIQKWCGSMIWRRPEPIFLKIGGEPELV